ncbi:hypothetical protein ILYODFUR_031235 [Ilyodon furcidens]|uniref:Uncharacterized protein n=1 Tax=Ilyodon furcidens TaxID=33524 RepID=A0ABV0T1T3_9TELE
MARISNSLSVLLLAQSQMSGMAGAEFGNTNDAALQASGLMSRELGHQLATLVVMRRQVWLAQAPVSDDCRQTLRSLPVVPGQLFGPEAERALERSRLQVAVPPSAPTPVVGQGDLGHSSCAGSGLVAGNSDTFGQKGHRSHDSTFAGRHVLFKVFPCTKEGDSLQPVLDFRCLNRFLKVLPFRMLCTSDILQARRVILFNRFEGRIFPRSHPSRTQEVPAVCLSRKGLPVCSPAVWPVPGSTGVYKVHEGSLNPSVPVRIKAPAISR